jgi:DNA-binding PadR family transcriptional regulator
MLDVLRSKVRRSVLLVLIEGQGSEWSGADLMKHLDVGPGTIYPVLVALERHGMVESRWEDSTAQELGRPRRRLYRITPLGWRSYQEALHNALPTSAQLRPNEQ